MICPHCGREIEVQQRRAASARWAGMTPDQRSAEMSRIRRRGIRARRPNKALQATAAPPLRSTS